MNVALKVIMMLETNLIYVFFLIALLFLLFDLETILVIPWVIVLKIVATHGGFWIVLEFLIELSIGLIYAWRMKVLEFI